MRLYIALILIFLLSPAYARENVTATWYGKELAGNRACPRDLPAR
jgi:hypothetical protein